MSAIPGHPKDRQTVGPRRPSPDRSPRLTEALVDALDDQALELLAERLRPYLGSRDGDDGGWLDARAAARHLGLPSVNALHRLTARRELPFSQDRPGGRLWFDRRDLDRWRMANRREAR